jgi:hypothetical protein
MISNFNLKKKIVDEVTIMSLQRNYIIFGILNDQLETKLTHEL